MDSPAKQNIFVSTTFAPDGTRVAEVVAQLLANGVPNIELGSNHCYEPDQKEQLLGLPARFLVHNYFPVPAQGLVVNIASAAPDIRAASLRHVLNSLNFCAEMGAELYTFHPGFVTDPSGVSLAKSNYDFRFEQGSPKGSQHQQAGETMLRGIETIVERARRRGVRVAMESEGSVRKKGHLLMQTPAEFERLLRRFAPDELGVNLNIGHLNLASAAFGFAKEELVAVVASHMVAIEMSHNYGQDDDHLPLQKDGWYWPLLADRRFAGMPKILEVRETALDQLLRNVHLCASCLDRHSAGAV